MLKHVFIVSGNHQEFADYLRRKMADTESHGVLYHYVSSVDMLRGFNDLQGFYIGSWRDRKDIEEIQMVIATSKRK